MSKKQKLRAKKNLAKKRLRSSMSNPMLNLILRFIKNVSKKASICLLHIKNGIKGLNKKLSPFIKRTTRFCSNGLLQAKKICQAIFYALSKKDTSGIKEFRDRLLANKIAVKYAGVLALTVVVILTTVKFDFKSVVVVNIKGKPVAVVPAKKDFDNILLSLQKEWGDVYNKEIILSDSPTFKTKILPRRLISTPSQVASAIEANTNLLIEVYAISVNGEPKVILKDQLSAQQVLESVKNKYKSEIPNERLEFFEDVKVTKNFALPDLVQSCEGAVEQLTQNIDPAREYKVKKGDTLWDIADNNNVKLEKLFELNPDLSDNLQLGQVIRVSAPKTLANVKTIQYVELEEETPYETKFENDPNKYRGDRRVIASGKTGKKSLKVQLVKQNGVEIGKIVLDENIISNPKTEVIAIGSKPRVEKSGTGTFRTPAFGSVTSRFGYRWGRFHEGIDIGGHIGDPIYSADGGVVVFSGIESGYGNLIKIDHGNGYVTFYGHNSKNFVKVGQRVEKGTKIALLGNTGNSTGPHLHFEVRKGGIPVDPLKFIR